MKWQTFKTKTFWVGLAGIVAGVGMIVAQGDIAGGAQTIVIGLLAIVGRDAITKVQEATK